MTDMIKNPSHYAFIENYEVKDINKALLDRIEQSDFDMSLYEAGWYQQSLQYFFRFYAKNGLEDLEKGIETMQFVVDCLKERKKESVNITYFDKSSKIDQYVKEKLKPFQHEVTRDPWDQVKYNNYKLYPESD